MALRAQARRLSGGKLVRDGTEVCLYSWNGGRLDEGFLRHSARFFQWRTDKEQIDCRILLVAKEEGD